MRQNNGSHRYQVLIPGTCKCYFIGKRVFARVINLRILRLSEWVLNAITIVLTREAEGDSTNIEEKMGETMREEGRTSQRDHERGEQNKPERP